MAAKIKLTDALIKYAQSGKSDRSDWKQFDSALVDKYGLISDTEVSGFKVVKSGADVISFRYYYRANGKRKNITLGHWPAITAVQARSLAKNKLLAVASGSNPLDDKQAARASTENTLQSYLDHDYGLYMRSRAIDADKYLNLIRNGFPELLNKPLAEINKTDLVKWVQAQTERHNQNTKGYASATIIQRHGSLKSLMSHAIRHGIIERSPFDRLDKLEFSTTSETTDQQAKRTYLTLEQQQALIKSVDAYDEKHKGSHHKTMMLILYYMGMRTGDVVSLEWVHVIDTPFACNITKVLEKTRRKVKTPFVMPMPEPVRAALKEWRKQQGNPTNGLVFPSPVTGKRLSKSPLSGCWSWIKQDAGLHTDLQLYTLRHNFISWLVMHNIPLPVIAGMVGHRTTDMINSNYGHLVKGATDTASKNFADLLKKQA